MFFWFFTLDNKTLARIERFNIFFIWTIKGISRAKRKCFVLTTFQTFDALKLFSWFFSIKQHSHTQSSNLQSLTFSEIPTSLILMSWKWLFAALNVLKTLNLFLFYVLVKIATSATGGEEINCTTEGQKASKWNWRPKIKRKVCVT